MFVGRTNTRRKWKNPRIEEWCSKHEILVAKCHLDVVQQSHINATIRKAVRTQDFDSIGAQLNQFKLSPTNYVKPLETMLLAEEYHQQMEMRKYDLSSKNIELHSAAPTPYGTCKIELFGLSRGQPSLIPSDYVVLDYYGEYKSCEITEIQGNFVLFKSPDNIEWLKGLQSMKFNLSFVLSGMMYARYRQVLDRMSSSSIVRALFEDPQDSIGDSGNSIKAPKIDIESTNTAALCERLSRCNEAQRTAISGILEAKCRPRPYILFGPPGTGKTFTVVETVVQIHERSPTSRILVCANSNNCADQLAAAIDDTNLCDDSLVRLCAQGHYNQLLSVKGKQWFHLAIEGLNARGMHRFRVFVTTNNMSWTLDNQRFDYVIVDEAGHAHEVETLTAASCLNPTEGCLVLAGDPKQLGPVIQCQEVAKLSLGVSMLERIFNINVYRRRFQGYDEKYITQLVNCYRCDPRILAPCNNLFYDGQLKCLGQTPPGLLNKMDFLGGNPLAFIGVNGKEDEQGNATSRSNNTEAVVCSNLVFYLYKKGINPDRIGLISHYKRQMKLILDKIKSKLPTEISKVEEALKELASEDLDYMKLQEQSDKEREAKLSAVKTQKEMKKVLPDLDDLTLDELCFDHSYEPSLGSDRYDDDSDFDSLEVPVRPSEAEKISNEKAADDKKIEVTVAEEPKKPKAKCWLPKVDTVDGFQGKEKEIIIISTVRCPEGGRNWDFVADSKRFNVAISRAKWQVIVVGHPDVLDCHENWREFKRHASVKRLQ